jgi:hypothetical protein
MEESHYEDTIKKSKSDNTVEKYSCKLKRIKRLLLAQYKIPLETPLETVDPIKVVDVVAKDSKYPDGRLKSSSSPEQARNAILWYYRFTLQVKQDYQLLDYFMTNLYFNILKVTDDRRIPDEYMIRLNDFIKGTDNIVTKAIDEGTYKSNSRDHVEFTTFANILKILLINDMILYEYYLVTWHHLNRGELSFRARYSHFRNENDNIKLDINKTKDNQGQ